MNGHALFAFALYGGTSTDGRGDGTYIGWTTDVEQAKRHWRHLQKAGPYSTGSIVVHGPATKSVIHGSSDESVWREFGPR